MTAERDIVGEVLEMVQANHEESGMPFDLDVNEDLYRTSPNIKVFHMDDDDGKIVGYAVYMVVPHQHHQTKVMAFCDVVYVVPEWRGSAVVEFLKAAEAALVDVNEVSAILYGMPVGKHEDLMKALGCEARRTEYIKVTE